MKCLSCNSEIPKNNDKYCSNRCQFHFENGNKIKEWLADPSKLIKMTSVVRKYLIKEAGYECSECKWDKINKFTNKHPLEIDHIDGDSTNNKPENLRVLCPNCHSLTPNYKGANKKSTRIWRKKYYSDIQHLKKMSSQKKIDKIKHLLVNSGIDFSKFGWVNKASIIIGITPQKVNSWMKRNMPELLNESFTRKI